MTDKTNPPRTRDARIADLIRAIHQFGPNVSTEIRSALDAERAEALAELRAGAEPVGYISASDLEFLKASPPRKHGSYHSAPIRNVRSDDEELPLYDHHPAPREAELVAKVERLTEALYEAQKEATIAWTVCASVHREFGKKDPLFTTRQADFTRAENAARAALAAAPEKK